MSPFSRKKVYGGEGVQKRLFSWWKLVKEDGNTGVAHTEASPTRERSASTYRAALCYQGHRGQCACRVRGRHARVKGLTDAGRGVWPELSKPRSTRGGPSSTAPGSSTLPRAGHNGKGLQGEAAACPHRGRRRLVEHEETDGACGCGKPQKAPTEHTIRPGAVFARSEAC